MKLLEQELKDIWRYSSQEEKDKFYISRMLIELKGKIKHVDHKIYKKDKTEIITFVFGMILFEYFYQSIPFLFSKITCALGIVWFVLVIVKFIKTKKTKPPKDLSFCLLEQLEYQKKHYQFQQARLFETSAFWYALPPFIMNMVFLIIVGESNTYDFEPYVSANLLLVLSSVKIIALVGFTLLFALSSSLYKHSVKKIIQPVINDIERVLFRLENEY